MADWKQAVSDGAAADLYYAHDWKREMPFSHGKVIAYTDRPTITVLHQDGTTTTWIADLAEIND